MANYFDQFDEPVAVADKPVQVPASKGNFFDQFDEQQATPSPASDPASEEKKSGLFNNTAAGLNEGVYGTLGAPVDAMAWLYNAAAAQARAISGAPVRNVEKPIGGSAWMGTAVNRATDAIAAPFGLDGVNDPANVEPRGPLERAARAAAQGVGSALAPEAIVGALGRAGMLTPGAMQAFAPVFGDATSGAWTARNMAIGGAGGVGAEQASSAAEEAGAGPWGQMAAGLAGGLVGGIGGDLASSGAGAAARGVGRAGQEGVDYFAPTQASVERGASRKLRKAASDPDKVAAMDLSQLDTVPGSQDTTFQATGDMGLGGLEREMQTRNPEAFQQRRADQNAARRDALDALSPDGYAEALPRALRGEAQAADAVAAQDIDAATTRATQEARALGGDLPPEASGAVMRQRVLDADSVARERERGLWQAVDPDGTLTIPTGETIGMARQIVDEMPRLAQPMGGSEAAIFDAVRALDGQPLPFRELHALRSRVSEAMRDELKTNGRTATYARLSRLRGGIERDLDGSVLARAEDGAPPASGVSLEDTWGSPASSPAADDGWPGPAPEALRASGRDAAPSPPDAVMREAADIATGRRAPYRVPSFLRWIAARGGVQPDANVEAVLDAADRRHGGILSLGGRSADEWGEAIAEHAGMRQRPDQNQVLDWISEAANGREPDWWRTLHANPDREEAARMAREVQRVAADEGIQLRSRRAALDLIEQEAALYGGNRVAQRAPAPAPEPIRPATFDDAAQERLRAASDATRERARTFAPLKDITRTRGTANDFVTPDAVVPQRIFVPGAKGQATVKAYLDAVGEEGRAPLHDYAVASLRRVAEKPDGTLDPAKVAAWRAKHQDALRALPDTDKALASAADASAAVDTLAATRRQATDMRQAGVVGKVMGLEDSQDVVRTVGSIFGKQDAVMQMRRLRDATAGNEEARAGLRKAIAEHINQTFISRKEAATSGREAIASDALQKFVLKNEQALSAVFNGEEVASLKRIAADLQRANRSIDALRIPGQSNTAQDLAALAKGERSTWDIMLTAIGGTWAGGPFAGIAAAMGAKAISAARRAGMQKVDDLVRDALLDPPLAQALMKKTASGKGTETLTRRLLYNALKGWDDGPLDDGPGGGSPPSGGPKGGGNGSRGLLSPLEVFNPARRGNQLPREGGTDLAAGAPGAPALRELGQTVAGVAPPGLRQGLSRDADAGVGSGALSAPEIILSGSGKPMPTKGAAGYRLRALKLDPNDYELQQVEGGFVAVRKRDVDPMQPSDAPLPMDAASPSATPETILSGTGKPMPTKGAAGYRLRALKLDPNDYELQQVEGGFVAVRKRDVDPMQPSDAPLPMDAASSPATPDTILSGSGKPMPTKGAAGYRLRALKLDPKNFDLRPVDGGFVAVRKPEIADARQVHDDGAGRGGDAVRLGDADASAARGLVEGDAHRAKAAEVAAPGVREGVVPATGAGEQQPALNASDTIWSGSGKPMPTKGAAGYRLRALKLDPKDYDLRPVDGGFVAVPKTAAVSKPALSASSPSKAAEDAKPPSARPIFDDVRSRLAAAGVPEKELDANAAVMEAYYKIRAKRLGVDAEALYRDQVPDIRDGAASRDLNHMKPQEIVDRLVQSRISAPAEDGSTGSLFVDPQAKTWDLFHGTTALNDFKRFDPSSEAAQIGTSLQGAEKGVVFLTPNPEEAGRYASFSDPQGEAGARIFRVAVSPGKTAVFDIPELLRSGDKRFATALKDAWARHDLGGNGRDLNAEMRAAKAMLARTDMDRPAVEHTLGATHAAIDLARKEGLDTVVVRGLNESKGGDQVIVLNPDRVFSSYTGDKLYQQAASSKHVDPSAKEWTLYHGTSAREDFKRFDPKKDAASPPGDAEHGAIFFTPDPAEAQRFAQRDPGAGAMDAHRRIIPTTVEPGKTRVFDIPQLLSGRDPEFRKALLDAGMSDASYERFVSRATRDGMADYDGGEVVRAALGIARRDGLDTAVMGGISETRGSDQIAILNPGRVKAAYTSDTMYQGDKSIHRGAATLGDGRAVIELFKARDASTFMHEAGHVFLRDMVQDAARAPAIKGDLDAVLKWFGADDATKITREHHEQFARGFEQYLRDGKAPSAGLKRAFEQFKDWLTGIYRSLTDLGQPIPDNIRGVYDRLLSEGAAGGPETILSGTGKAMPTKGAALNRLRAMGRDPKDFDLRPVEGGFVAVSKAEAASAPTATGPFGPVHEQFLHDARGAVARLMADQDGEAVAALHHPEVGDIDLVWGKAPSQDQEGYGLAKIAVKHPEVLGDLQGFLGRLSVDPERSGANRVRLRDKTGEAVVSLNWFGQEKRWLLTAYERENAGGSATMDTAAQKVGDDTARPGTGERSLPPWSGS